MNDPKTKTEEITSRLKLGGESGWWPKVRNENTGVGKFYDFDEMTIEGETEVALTLQPTATLRITSVNVASCTLEEKEPTQRPELSCVEILYVKVGNRICAAFSHRHPTCNPGESIQVFVRNFSKKKARILVQLNGWEDFPVNNS
jgi:hypothetical protein